MTFNELYLTLREKGYSAIESPGVINIISHKTEERVAHISSTVQCGYSIYDRSKVESDVRDILRLYANTPLNKRTKKKYLLYVTLENGMKLYATRLWFKDHDGQEDEITFTMDRKQAHAFDIMWLTVFLADTWFLSKEEV